MIESNITFNGAKFTVEYGGCPLGNYSSISQAQAALNGARHLVGALAEDKLKLADVLRCPPTPQVTASSHLRDHPLLKRQKP
jgi:hypothetical protein